ncbi:MAG: biotin--[acetyl-CoA-carboxylase] ligase [Subtercola sp.]|nr:biotin--[acetyl-CoA-carboxylase] ligase [Subtercola sp.]
MNLPQSEAVVPRLVWLAEATSTNSELVRAATGPDATTWPDLSVLVTDNQIAGRGRLGRVWSAPAGASLAISVLLRPTPVLPIESLAWIPLIAGVAMSRAVNNVLGVSSGAVGDEEGADEGDSESGSGSDAESGSGADSESGSDAESGSYVDSESESDSGSDSTEAADGYAADDANPYGELTDAEMTANEAAEDAAARQAPAAVATVKWPNDVLIGRAKVSGILSELLPGQTGVVVGAGVNLFLTEDELPVPTATSIALAGATDFTADDLLSAYLVSFAELYELFTRWNGDAAESGIAAIVADACSTLGQPVAVELPAGEVVTGLASGLDASGRLVVIRDSDARTIAVSAGDVTHLRY